MSLSLLYDFTIIFYAASVCFYFIDYYQNNRKASRIAFWLLIIVWILQDIVFYTKVQLTGEFPILTPLDGLFFLSWLIITASLILTRFYRLHFFAFFANLLGFIMMAMTLFRPDDRVSDVLSHQLMSDLLIIHITMAFISYAAFTISFILSVMYWIEYSMLKRKKWGRRLGRFSSLAKLEQTSFLCNLTGFPLLLISLILGIDWAFISLSSFNWLDVKVLTSFIILIVYGFYFYQKLGRNVSGKSLIYWNTTGFLIVLINVFLSESYTGFHLW
ncbi:MAG: cytochrome C assembly family protein [Tuberibacillus sp.]